MLKSDNLSGLANTATARTNLGLGALATQSGAWTAWSPTRTGWTDVGAPTVTARYAQIGSVVFFQVKIVPSTTTATVAGTSYISLPVTPGANAMQGDGSMENITTLIAVGICSFDIANARCYPPTQGATGNTLTIAGWYEA